MSKKTGKATARSTIEAPYMIGDNEVVIRLSEQQFLNELDDFRATLTPAEKVEFAMHDDLFKKTMIVVPLISEIDEKLDMFAHGFVAGLDCVDHLKKHKHDYSHCDIAAGIIASLNNLLSIREADDDDE